MVENRNEIKLKTILLWQQSEQKKFYRNLKIVFSLREIKDSKKKH